LERLFLISTTPQGGYEMTQESAVIIVEPFTMKELVIRELFAPGGLDAIFADIKKMAKEHVPDLTTVTGRKAIASNAYKVSQSKLMVDGKGKELNESKRVEINAVDAERKKFREQMDALRDELRAPLDAWEKAELAKIEAETAARLAKEAAEAEEKERVIQAQLAEIEALKAAAAKVEADRLAAEKAEKDRVRIEEEAKYAEEVRLYDIRQAEEKAAVAATLAAEQAAAAQIAEAARREREAAEALELAERRRVAEAALAEENRLAAIAEEQRKAAALAAQVEANRKALEAADLAKAAAEKAEADKKAANTRHQASVNIKAMSAVVMSTGVTQEVAKAIITAIAKGQIPGVTINY
jgi:hypothetical protein